MQANDFSGASLLLKRIKLGGKVFSGTGKGEKFLSLPWVKRQIEEKLGFTPYQGTLNMILSHKSAKLRELLETVSFIEIQPAEGYSRGKLYKACIGKTECAIVIPEVTDYPKDYLEVIAAENLREKLKLRDGDKIKVIVIL
jgi:riboflavin kinase, archaea type